MPFCKLKFDRLLCNLIIHVQNDSIPGTLRNSDGGPLVYSGTDVNDQ